MSGENFDQYVTRHALCEIKFSKSYPASRACIDVWRARQPLVNCTLRPNAHSRYEAQAAWRSTRRGDWLWPDSALDGPQGSFTRAEWAKLAAVTRTAAQLSGPIGERAWRDAPCFWANRNAPPRSLLDLLPESPLSSIWRSGLSRHSRFRQRKPTYNSLFSKSCLTKPRRPLLANSASPTSWRSPAPPFAGILGAK